ncbi:MAG: hypothetical protein HY043_23170 [Verrucomicrobia bacterium]|nr:hypothetical protein [Verrucomicrobiota bacterium]
MVAKPVATPVTEKVPVSLDFVPWWRVVEARSRRQRVVGQAGEVMATGFEI